MLSRLINQPAQNSAQIGVFGGRTTQPPVGSAAYNPIQTSPLFGRPSWTYVNTQTGPVRGPQPRLARGSGLTGDPSLGGNASQLPGYLSDNEYYPTLFAHDPINQPVKNKPVPMSIGVGNDGRDMVGTYKPHDFVIGRHDINSLRQAANWQVQEYPPNYRDTLKWQQVQKYRINNFTLQARPLTQNDYFVGYQINPQVQAQMGQSTLGNLGSI